MKKMISTLMVAGLLAISISVLGTTVGAQTRSYDRRPTQTYTYKKPSFYRRHRNLINIAIGTGGGAVLGGIIGGKKGALIGAAAGAGGSALYTYKINPKKRRF
ncbi:MAG: hypothetical protein HS105_01980 [Chloracidobacterium sp.]|nr:hypothetical protein [Chloracidobacterium sp.]MCC6824185.1 hypothetical protein [Acidobacteriota bacterium]MCO5334472.1 hypothetical protein [Pyrinomonadaceae bacterium]